MIKRYSLIHFFICTLFFLCSCSEISEVKRYSYNETFITRIDKDCKTRIYYGNLDEPISDKHDEYLTIDWCFDRSLDGYLIFEDSTIFVVKLEGDFEAIGKNENFKIRDYVNNIGLSNWTDSIKGEYDNVIRISHSEELEIIINDRNNSKIIRH